MNKSESVFLYPKEQELNYMMRGIKKSMGECAIVKYEIFRVSDGEIVFKSNFKKHALPLLRFYNLYKFEL